MFNLRTSKVVQFLPKMTRKHIGKDGLAVQELFLDFFLERFYVFYGNFRRMNIMHHLVSELMILPKIFDVLVVTPFLKHFSHSTTITKIFHDMFQYRIAGYESGMWFFLGCVSQHTGVIGSF